MRKLSKTYDSLNFDKDKYRFPALVLLVILAVYVALSTAVRAACDFNTGMHNDFVSNCCANANRNCTTESNIRDQSAGHCTSQTECNRAASDSYVTFQSIVPVEHHVQAVLIVASLFQRSRGSRAEINHPADPPTSFPRPPIFLLNRTLLD